MVSFLEILIEVDCSEGRRTLSQVGESRGICLPRDYIFQRMDSDWREPGRTGEILFRFWH
jgi:hypothetical protein